ncbi:MAG: sigma-70 factor domain-containing protein [Ktedonobacteraceae bacterium]
MIDLERDTAGALVPCPDTETMNTDLAKQYDDILGRLLKKDLTYTHAGECGGKDGLELEEDSTCLDSAPLELEDMAEIHEEPARIPSPPELKNTSILALPAVPSDETSHPRRAANPRRRRSEDADENNAQSSDAGESDAVMTYLREIGRVPMITHEREVELAQRIEMGDRTAQ